MSEMHGQEDDGEVVGRVETVDPEYDAIREDDHTGPTYTGAEVKEPDETGMPRQHPV